MNRKGITLVALIVTVIVLLILAGITINLTIGQDGILKRAQETGVKQKIAEVIDKLTMAEATTNVNTLGKITLKAYLEEVYKENLALEDITQIIEEDKECIIVSEEGYTFNIKLVGNNDIVIDYVGNSADLPAIISVVNKTENSIQVKIIKVGKSILSCDYNIKLSDDENYSENTKVTGEDREYIFTGLQAGNNYDIQVNVRYSDGDETIEKKEIQITKISLNKNEMYIKPGKIFTLTAEVLAKNVTNNEVVWYSDNENIATVNENGVVTANALGEAIITAKTTDGSNLSSTCKVKVVENLYLLKNGVDNVAVTGGWEFLWQSQATATITFSDKLMKIYSGDAQWGTNGIWTVNNMDLSGFDTFNYKITSDATHDGSYIWNCFCFVNSEDSTYNSPIQAHVIGEQTYSIPVESLINVDGLGYGFVCGNCQSSVSFSSIWLE